MAEEGLNKWGGSTRSENSIVAQEMDFVFSCNGGSPVEEHPGNTLLHEITRVVSADMALSRTYEVLGEQHCLASDIFVLHALFFERNCVLNGTALSHVESLRKIIASVRCLRDSGSTIVPNDRQYSCFLDSPVEDTARSLKKRLDVLYLVIMRYHGMPAQLGFASQLNNFVTDSLVRRVKVVQMQLLQVESEKTRSQKSRRDCSNHRRLGLGISDTTTTRHLLCVASPRLDGSNAAEEAGYVEDLMGSSTKHEACVLINKMPETVWQALRDGCFSTFTFIGHGDLRCCGSDSGVVFVSGGGTFYAVDRGKFVADLVDAGADHLDLVFLNGRETAEIGELIMDKWPKRKKPPMVIYWDREDVPDCHVQEVGRRFFNLVQLGIGYKKAYKIVKKSCKNTKDKFIPRIAAAPKRRSRLFVLFLVFCSILLLSVGSLLWMKPEHVNFQLQKGLETYRKVAIKFDLIKLLLQDVVSSNELNFSPYTVWGGEEQPMSDNNDDGLHLLTRSNCMRLYGIGMEGVDRDHNEDVERSTNAREGVGVGNGDEQVAGAGGLGQTEEDGPSIGEDGIITPKNATADDSEDDVKKRGAEEDEEEARKREEKDKEAKAAEEEKKRKEEEEEEEERKRKKIKEEEERAQKAALEVVRKMEARVVEAELLDGVLHQNMIASILREDGYQFYGRRILFHVIKKFLNGKKYPKRTLMLHGPAGSGKSYSLAHYIYGGYFEGRIASYHFCSRGNPTSLRQEVFVKNVIMSLAINIPGFEEALKSKGVNVFDIEGFKLFDDLTFAQQDKDAISIMQEYIIEPLENVANPGLEKFAVVLDGLDDALVVENRQQSIVTLIEWMLETPRWPDWMKIILTSRRKILNDPNNELKERAHFFALNQIKKDIEKYVKMRLREEICPDQFYERESLVAYDVRSGTKAELNEIKHNNERNLRNIEAYLDTLKERVGYDYYFMRRVVSDKVRVGTKAELREIVNGERGMADIEKYVETLTERSGYDIYSEESNEVSVDADDSVALSTRLTPTEKEVETKTDKYAETILQLVGGSFWHARLIMDDMNDGTLDCSLDIEEYQGQEFPSMDEYYKRQYIAEYAGNDSELLQQYDKELRPSSRPLAKNLTMTALMLASYHGHLDVVVSLLEEGSDVNVGNLLGTPLSFAVRRGHLEVVKALLDHGADVNYKEEKDGNTPLIISCLAGQREIVSMLLSMGASVNDRSTSDLTALMAAAYIGNESIVRMLLENGAEISHEARRASTIASSKNHTKLAKFIKAVVNGKEARKLSRFNATSTSPAIPPQPSIVTPDDGSNSTATKTPTVKVTRQSMKKR